MCVCVCECVCVCVCACVCVCVCVYVHVVFWENVITWPMECMGIWKNPLKKVLSPVSYWSQTQLREAAWSSSYGSQLKTREVPGLIPAIIRIIAVIIIHVCSRMSLLVSWSRDFLLYVMINAPNGISSDQNINCKSLMVGRKKIMSNIWTRVKQNYFSIVTGK